MPYIIPYSALIHDIDIAMITNTTKIDYSYLQETGKRSGTAVDLFFISPAVVAGSVNIRHEKEIFKEALGISL